MTTRQLKTIFVNATYAAITTPTGTKPETPVLFYKSDTLIRWIITNSDGTVLNLTSCTFTLKIGSEYVNSDLYTVANSGFSAGDWDGWSTANGMICCRVNLTAANILAYLGTTASETCNVSLWATTGGKDYCLANFGATIKSNIY